MASPLQGFNCCIALSQGGALLRLPCAITLRPYRALIMPRFARVVFMWIPACAGMTKRRGNDNKRAGVTGEDGNMVIDDYRAV